MKNQKGISLIALIITIIVIIILAAIVIGGVFNTPSDAKFANFCQEYDRVQTAIQLKYYELYQKYATNTVATYVPTHYSIYNEVATGTAFAGTAADDNDEDNWVKIENWGKTSTNVCEKPSLAGDWFLRESDGKLVYAGFEKDEGKLYLTPSFEIEGRTPVAGESAITGASNVLKTDDTSLALSTAAAPVVEPGTGD
ncbi:MAG: hypothetical protein IJ217_00210 [Clostridia bacterium]|nr:hypothetical protein [Clostridia bacterium]